MFTNNDNNNSDEALGYFRMRCASFCDILDDFTECCGSDLPIDIVTRLIELSNELTELVGYGFTYHVYFDANGEKVIDTLPLDK